MSDNAVYVDSREAWRAPIAAFIAEFFQVGYMRSSPLLLLALHHEYDVPKSILLSTSVLNFGIDKVMSPVAEKVSKELGVRTTVSLGALLIVLNLFLIYWVPITAGTVIGFLGFGLGISGSFVTIPLIHVIAISFNKRRGLAMSIVKVGVSLGTITLPPLFVFLCDVYGGRGTYLILSSFFLHLLVSAALLPRNIIDGNTQKVIFKSPNFINNVRVRCFGKTDSEKSLKLRMMTDKPLIIRMPLLILYSITMVFSITFLLQIIHSYPLYAAEMGLSSYIIASTLSVSGIFDFVWRVVFAYLIDRLTNKARLLIIGSSLLGGGILIILVVVFKCVIPIAFIFNIYFSMPVSFTTIGWIPVLVGFTDITHFPRALSLILMTSGFFLIISVIIVKIIYTFLGSYSGLFLIYGLGMIVCSFSFITEGVLFDRCHVVVNLGNTCTTTVVTDSEEDDEFSLFSDS